MRSGIWLALLVALGVGLTIGGRVTLAEPATSREFYDHNYAATVGGQQGAEKGNAPHARAATEREPVESLDVRAGKVNGSANQGKRRRLSVSVYVNSKDSAHFNRTLDEILRLHDTKTVRITNVSHIGDYRAITDDTQRKLGARDIAVSQVDVPPKDFGITLSPAWCVQTREGIHIVEGASSITSFIDAWGDFKPRADEKVTPDEKLAGF